MTDTITLTGLVATIPRHHITSAGLPLTSFRLASTQRRFDRAKNCWVDGETNWYTVTAFRQLATNLLNSLNKGERIIVTGRLRIRDWATAERTGTNIELDAEAVGHDLSWGTASFTRIISGSIVATAALDPNGAGGIFPSSPTDYSTNLTQSDWPTTVPGGPGEDGYRQADAGEDGLRVEAETPVGGDSRLPDSQSVSTGTNDSVGVEVPF